MRRISWLAASTVIPNNEVGENLVVAAHANMAAAELTLQPPIDPLGPRAHDVTTLLGKDETERPSRPLLALQRLFYVNRASGVHVDDRFVTQQDASVMGRLPSSAFFSTMKAAILFLTHRPRVHFANTSSLRS